MRRHCALTDVFLDAVLWVDDMSIYTDCAFVGYCMHLFDIVKYVSPCQKFTRYAVRGRKGQHQHLPCQFHVIQWNRHGVE